MMADRAAVSGMGFRYIVKFLDDSNHSTMCNAKQPVCQGDILMLPESGQYARR